MKNSTQEVMVRNYSLKLKIDFISDLHLDFWVKELNPQNPKFNKQIQEFIKMINPLDGDVLVIAGDIGHSNQQAKFLLQIFLNLYFFFFLKYYPY